MNKGESMDHTDVYSSKVCDHPMLLSSNDSCTSNECLSDVSSCEEWGSTEGTGNVYKVARRQYSFLPVCADVSSARDGDRERDSEDSGSSSSAMRGGSHRDVGSSGRKSDRQLRGDSAMDEIELSTAMDRSCKMKERLCITIPKSEYFIFPSDLPKASIVECLQSLFDLISAIFPSRYDNDKHSWAVYSSIPAMATRFKIHIYDFDGVTHVEMRAESGCEKYGRAVFRMLQAAVGRKPPMEDGLPMDVDYYIGIIADCVPHSDIMGNRDMKRNMKSINRAIQGGSVVELESACVSILQAGVFEDMFPVLADCIQPIIDRILADDITKKIPEPLSPVVNPLSERKVNKIQLKSGRQKGYSVSVKSEWNAYVRASDVLRRLSYFPECQEIMLRNICAVTYFVNFITASEGHQKAFLLRRNIAKVLDNLTTYKPYDVLMCGLTEKVFLSWLSTGSEQYKMRDPQFEKYVRNTMQNLGFSLP